MSPPKRTFTYKKVDKLEIPLDLYLPEDAKSVPILLWFHGGGLLQGIRSSVSPHMLRAVQKHNLALISADYRLAPQVGVKDIYEDVRDCVAFIRNQMPGKVGEGVIDASRVAVSGSSAGGYLAFLAGLYVEPKPQVILPIYPITDPLGRFFTTPQPPALGGSEPDVESVKPYTDPSAQVVASSEPTSKRGGMYGYMLKSANLADLLGVKKGDDTWRVARKVYERGLPPTYVVHGDADTAVGVEQADEVVGVMVGLGKEVVYERLHGVEHLFDKAEDAELDKMYEWLLKHL
jgi:acetyl esterase/lipase